MSKYISDCCRAKIRYSGPTPDFIGEKYPEVGTCYIICTKCEEPCNFYVPVRKTWKRNPVTKIQKNKKKDRKPLFDDYES